PGATGLYRVDRSAGGARRRRGVYRPGAWTRPGRRPDPVGCRDPECRVGFALFPGRRPETRLRRELVRRVSLAPRRTRNPQVTPLPLSGPERFGDGHEYRYEHHAATRPAHGTDRYDSPPPGQW